jgi:undecaprenyl-diphosphatase
MLIDTVDNYRGGNYGFFSAHASNTFSIALFFSLLMRRRWLVVTLVCYSLVNCWTRLYLGVHYPGDITVGLIWGSIVGYCVYRLYCKITIPAVYSERICYVPIVVFLLTLLFALCRGYYIAFA